MVEVATGGDEGGEQLPMVLKVPHFNAPTTVCYHSYSMLGFGDILVPGKYIIYFFRQNNFTNSFRENNLNLI